MNKLDHEELLYFPTAGALWCDGVDHHRGYRLVFSWNSSENVFTASAPELPGCHGEGATRVDAFAALERAMATRSEPFDADDLARANDPFDRGLGTDYSILVVDDEPDIRRLLERQLGRHGYDAFGASSVPAALGHLQGSAPPDLVLSDLEMPRYSGLDLILALKRLEIPIPVIVMSGRAENELWRGALDAGAVAYLPKPFRLEELLATIERALISSP